jgi:hypothetical protein
MRVCRNALHLMQVCKYSESFRLFLTVRKPLDRILSCTNPYHIHRICQHVISICIHPVFVCSWKSDNQNTRILHFLQMCDCTSCSIQVYLIIQTIIGEQESTLSSCEYGNQSQSSINTSSSLSGRTESAKER